MDTFLSRRTKGLRGSILSNTASLMVKFLPWVRQMREKIRLTLAKPVILIFSEVCSFYKIGEIVSLVVIFFSTAPWVGRIKTLKGCWSWSANVNKESIPSLKEGSLEFLVLALDSWVRRFASSFVSVVKVINSCLSIIIEPTYTSWPKLLSKLAILYFSELSLNG